MRRIDKGIHASIEGHDLTKRERSGFHCLSPKRVFEKDSKRNMLAKIDCLMAGRVGEEIFLGLDDVTTGCHDDLSKATQLAYAFLKQVAFNEELNWISGPHS